MVGHMLQGPIFATNGYTEGGKLKPDLLVHLNTTHYVNSGHFSPSLAHFLCWSPIGKNKRVWAMAPHATHLFMLKSDSSPTIYEQDKKNVVDLHHF